MSSSHARISPTAHYTGYVWYRNGLSHPALRTLQGRILYDALAPFNAGSRRFGGPTLDGLLLARHVTIDRVLDQAIADGRVQQVIEIAAGLSPRGWDFARRHGSRVSYIEADLPDMATRKRALLDRAQLASPHHRVVPLDALAGEGPLSLSSLADTLDERRGLAIVTEGLLNYFPRAAVNGMWRRFASTLGRFSAGLYVSDLHLKSDNRGLLIDAFTGVLATFVRGRVHIDFSSAEDAERDLEAAGFGRVHLFAPAPQPGRSGQPDPAGAAVVRVIEAWTR